MSLFVFPTDFAFQHSLSLLPVSDTEIDLKNQDLQTTVLALFTFSWFDGVR
jgi:hypothetical protein